MSDTFAVRWARRELKRMSTMDYTKWHGSQDGSMFTFCGLAVPIGLAGTFLPETDSNTNKVNCRKCSRLLTKRAPDRGYVPKLTMNPSPPQAGNASRWADCSTEGR